LSVLLSDQIEEVLGSGIFVPCACRYTNQTGTPIVSATDLNTGEAIADKYSLAFTSVVATTSATVTVTGAPTNPYTGNSASVSLNSSTVYTEIIPGIALVFSNAFNFANTWLAQVRLGSALGALQAFGTGIGAPTLAIRHQVQNLATQPTAGALVSLVNNAIQIKTVGSIFASIQQFAPGSTMKLSSGACAPYHITVSGVSGSGASKIATVNIDGSPVTVLDPVTNTSISSTGLHCDGRSYTVQSGGCTGLVFILDENLTGSSTASVSIFDVTGQDVALQIAPDISGLPGTFGSSGVTLTETGQSGGVITSNGLAYYWQRAVAFFGANVLSNPFCLSPMLSASITSQALWR
jgi:hypothetical protein